MLVASAPGREAEAGEGPALVDRVRDRGVRAAGALRGGAHAAAGSVPDPGLHRLLLGVAWVESMSFALPLAESRAAQFGSVDAGVKRVFDLFHLGHQISRLDEFRGSVSSGKDDVKVRLGFANCFYFFQYLRHIEKFVIKDVNDFIEDKNTILPIDAAIQSNLREITTRVLASLTPREERVLRMRFGIGMNTDHTLEEVGQQFSVTRERIRQIEAKALRKLKHPSRSRKMRSFLDQ